MWRPIGLSTAALLAALTLAQPQTASARDHRDDRYGYGYGGGYGNGYGNGYGRGYGDHYRDSRRGYERWDRRRDHEWRERERRERRWREPRYRYDYRGGYDRYPYNPYWR